jgi:glycosyltransferase involved in cell wall biosynthesis
VLAYSVITPLRDERDNLVRLAAALAAQDVLPQAWVLVENGSTDGSDETARELARSKSWIHVVELPAATAIGRGGTVTRAFHAGLDALPELPDVVVKLDADTSMAPDHFRGLLERFGNDDRLGIASGSCWEEESGAWRQRHVTGASVWGAARAYRRECLPDVLPLEERMGWDGIDEAKAAMCGWRTRTFPELPFRHHRLEGERDGARSAAWTRQGEVSYYMGYRPSYLLLRVLHRALAEPAALAILWGYARSAVRREGRHPSRALRRHIRRDQRLRHLPVRVLEAFGRIG